MDSTNQRHSGNILLTGVWSIPCPLYDDELLSSWLVRTAIANGCDPLTLTGDIWGAWRPWTLDIDRGIPDEKLNILAKKCSTTPDKFDYIFLRRIVRKIVGCEPYAKQSWPWVLAIGARNRMRTGGLQYCPSCLGEKAYFRCHWRLAWHCCCVTHNTVLRDCCEQCLMPIEPHRLEAHHRSIVFCPNCLSDLSKFTNVTPSEETLLFQCMADRALSDGYCVYSSITLPVSEWFDLAHFFYKFVNRMINSDSPLFNSLACYFGANDIPKKAPQLEKSNIEIRSRRLSVVAKLLNLDREMLALILKEHCISQRCFCPKGTRLPPCLSCVSEELKSKFSPKKVRINKELTLPFPRPWHEVKRRSIRVRRKLMDINE